MGVRKITSGELNAMIFVSCYMCLHETLECLLLYARDYPGLADLLKRGFEEARRQDCEECLGIINAQTCI